MRRLLLLAAALAACTPQLSRAARGQHSKAGSNAGSSSSSSSSSSPPTPTSYLAGVRAPPANESAASVWAAHPHLPNFEELKQATGDTWHVLPKALNASYKNPCWRPDPTKKRLSCLPYFQVLGVSNCGSTDLFNRLSAHPDVLPCPWKGPHFFDEARYPNVRETYHEGFNGSFQSYVNLYEAPALVIAKDAKGAQCITGEASSSTFTNVLAYVRGTTVSKKTNATLAEYLYEVTPYARFIVLLRDPVQRYMLSWHKAHHDWPASVQEEFHELAAGDVRAWRNCRTRSSEAQCLQHNHPHNLIRGMYAAHLLHWLKVFPRESILVLRTEDFHAEPLAHVKACLEFLGMRQLPDAALAKAGKPEKALRPRGEMASKTRKLLENFYKPFNKRLVELMGGGDSRWLWGY